MKLRIAPAADDDPGYLACIENAVSALVKRAAPEEIFLVRMDNWFDQGFLNYGVSGEHPEDFRIPPFRKSHIVSELYFLKNETGKYETAKPRFVLHPAMPEKTGPRLLRDYAESTLLVWFASKSKIARRGSLMIYHVDEGRITAWFALFSKNGVWRVANAHGAAPESVAAIARCS